MNIYVSRQQTTYVKSCCSCDTIYVRVFLPSGPRFIIQKTNELLLILVTFACRLREYKKVVDFPHMSLSLTCIGRIRAL